MPFQSYGAIYLTGLCEIGRRSYLAWQWLKADQPLWWYLVRTVLLSLYGTVATWQMNLFSKTGGTCQLVSITLA